MDEAIHNNPEFQEAMSDGDPQRMADLGGMPVVLPSGRIVSPPTTLTPMDTNKTSWQNGLRWKTEAQAEDQKNDALKVLLGMSSAIERAVQLGRNNTQSGGQLKEGDPLWSEGYEQALQLRILFDALGGLVADLLHRGVCVLVTKCGKVQVVPDFASHHAECGDPDCARCNQLLYGCVHQEIVGTGRFTYLIDEDKVNFQRFRSEGEARDLRP